MLLFTLDSAGEVWELALESVLLRGFGLLIHCPGQHKHYFFAA